MNNFFALEWTEQNARLPVEWANTMHSAVGVERYSIEVEEQLAALKPSNVALRHGKGVAPLVDDRLPVLGAPTWPEFAEVERYLAELEQTMLSLNRLC